MCGTALVRLIHRVPHRHRIHLSFDLLSPGQKLFYGEPPRADMNASRYAPFAVGGLRPTPKNSCRRQNVNCATSWPVLGGYWTDEVPMDPKPETICWPGWVQEPFPPVASLHTGAVCGLMVRLLIVGLLK